MGADHAAGDTLLFLHADTQLPPDFQNEVERVLSQPRVVAGAFPLSIASAGWGLKLVMWGTQQRSRWLQLPYGDQALFLRRSTFDATGGFPLLPIMEDFVWVRRLQRLGRIALANSPVLTSDRRWKRLGLVRTTIVNQLMILGYGAGVSPHRLARWYRR
jgi:rSAM/selenodomain-associated transferase 2